MKRQQRLELTWIGKDVRPKLEPRILLADLEKSYHAKHRVTSADFFDNQLIFGDNLLALKALKQDYAGKVKCVFIDPPYNTGSAFTHYDDGVEHSIWLSLMRDRLEIIRRLLSEEGSLWITIDNNSGDQQTFAIIGAAMSVHRELGHRYRTSAGIRSLNELRPLLGLELTATPFVASTGGKTTPFKNVVMDYPLARAIENARRESAEFSEQHALCRKPYGKRSQNRRGSDRVPERQRAFRRTGRQAVEISAGAA